MRALEHGNNENLPLFTHPPCILDMDVSTTPLLDPLANTIRNLENTASMSDIMERAPEYLPIPIDIFRSTTAHLHIAPQNILRVDTAHTIPIAELCNPTSCSASDISKEFLPQPNVQRPSVENASINLPAMRPPSDVK